MYKILVAIDFSNSANNTLNHAVSVAEKFKAKILLIWVESSKSLKHLNISRTDNLKEEVNNRFDSLISSIESEELRNNLETFIIKGNSSEEIIKLAKEKQVDLIFEGSHGFHGFKRYLVGSNANKIIAEASCPVITVRPNREVNRELNTIVVPIDSTLDTRQKLPLTVKLAIVFGAEVHLLGLYFNKNVSTKRKVDSYTEQADAYCKKYGVKDIVIHNVYTEDGARTIINYAKKVNAGLISVMIEAEFGGSNWSLLSQGKQFINQSPIPILSIANKELIKRRPGL